MYAKTRIPVINKGNVICTYFEVKVQKRGIPLIRVTGLSAKQSKNLEERIKLAFSSINVKLPPYKFFIHFEEFNQIQDFHYYDLSVISTLLGLLGFNDLSQESLFVGEVLYDGSISDCGEYASLFYNFACKNRFKRLYINAPSVETLDSSLLVALKAQHLSDIVNLQENNSTLPILKKCEFIHVAIPPNINLVGNIQAKRCLEICIAGGHHLLLLGPPGVGKSSLIKFIPYLHSATLNENFDFYMHNIAFGNLRLKSDIPVVGVPLGASFEKIFGKDNKGVGDYLLMANKGYLYIDEFMQHPARILEGLKGPLDMTQNTEESSKFTLIALSNPCNCGNYGSGTRKCICSQNSVSRYRSKVSGGLLDRFHLMTYIDVDSSILLNESSNRDTWYLSAKDRVTKSLNFTDLTLTPRANTLLRKSAEAYTFSNRNVINTLKVARTIANLSQNEQIDEEHVLEALSYRPTHFNV